MDVDGYDCDSCLYVHSKGLLSYKCEREPSTDLVREIISVIEGSKCNFFYKYAVHFNINMTSFTYVIWISRRLIRRDYFKQIVLRVINFILLEQLQLILIERNFHVCLNRVSILTFKFVSNLHSHWTYRYIVYRFDRLRFIERCSMEWIGHFRSIISHISKRIIHFWIFCKNKNI